MAQSRGRNIARYLTISVTQGSGDAFVQGSVSTGIIPEEGRGLQVVGMEVAFNPGLEAVSADFDVYWSLTRDTKASVAYYSDDDTILYDGFCGSLTTSGQIYIPLRHQYPPQDGIFIVEPNIYFQLDSAATGLQLTSHVRVYYSEVQLSEVDILRILNNS